MYIDPHVHLRDFNQKHKETIKHGLEVARDSGVDAVFEMPNTDPPIVTRELVVERLKLSEQSGVPEVFHGIYIGLTADLKQVKNAVNIYNEFFPRVVGMKLYAGHSVGNLGVTKLEEQKNIYKALTEENYKGILVVHSEKESEMESEKWNPVLPITHSYARPEKAEVESVKDQIEFAKDSGFKGKLHIGHISVPEAVELVVQAKIDKIDASCGICPHHFIFDWNQMSVKNGILWKMNPPLRSPQSKTKMLELLKEGKIDFIETDHAPHTFTEKKYHPFMSGIPGLAWWDLFAEFLRKNGFSEKQIEDLTFENARKRFELKIEKTDRQRINHRNEYSFNPYEAIEKELNA
ncbi:dihydroorotase family protein [Candidatus Pacearchaeota archaeon]|nr:dihydroorotase family protein [Candidatus Pacearchaeota archaeon]